MTPSRMGFGKTVVDEEQQLRFKTCNAYYSLPSWK